MWLKNTFTSSILSIRQSKNPREALFRATSKEHSRRGHGKTSTQCSQYSQFKSVNPFAKKKTPVTDWKLLASARAPACCFWGDSANWAKSKVFSLSTSWIIPSNSLDASFSDISKTLRRNLFQIFPVPLESFHSTLTLGTAPPGRGIGTVAGAEASAAPRARKPQELAT